MNGWLHLRRIWRQITTTRYARAVEAELARQCAEVTRQRAEIERLRAENRALLNSILGVAGIPPLPISPRSTNPASPAGGRRPGGPALPAQSHSESARADDESVLRSPPPDTPVGEMAGACSSGNDSPGAPLPNGQGTRPRNDSLHSPASAGDAVEAQGFSPAKTNGPTGPSLLPQAVAETLSERQHASADSRLRPVAPPHRRRSWHQINRILEIESARKQVVSA